MEYKDILVGRKIVAVYLADDKKAIRFDLEDGEEVIAKTDGDCCSHSWIENVEGVDALIGGTVAAVEDIEMPDLGQPKGEYGVVAYYGCKITTDKGHCILDYRNDSNGYYGGNLAWPGDYFYGGVWGQNVSTLDWQKLSP